MPPTNPDNRAVSPVIGVVLMIAITVILAAAIGTFVLGMTPSEDTAPTATVTIHEHEDPGTLSIEHEIGDALDLDEHVILVDNFQQDEPANLSGTLEPGETQPIGELDAVADPVTVTLRHDPSGTIIAEDTIRTDA